MKKFTKFLMVITSLIVLFSRSNFAQSNVTYFEITVIVTLSTGLIPIGVEVELDHTYLVVTDPSGIVVFDSVSGGPFYLTASKIGYDTYVLNNSVIYENQVFCIPLSEKKYPPTCLHIDPLTLKATWCEPLRTALDEDFEDPTFPPPGWQSLSHEQGWHRTNDGSSGNWTVPPWESFYAVTKDEVNGCCDYLITPTVDLRESEGYVLMFNSFYDGAFGQLAFVEYSLDAGDTWELLCQVAPAEDWTYIELNLAAFCGPEGPEQIMFAFHADDAGTQASGWAVDNVKIQVPAPAANYLDFWVFLDDSLVGVTTETNWNYAPLMYGQTYTASVAARYTSGLSSKDYYTFFCKYLFPPDSLTGTAPDDAAILTWTPPLEYWPVQATAGMSYEEYLAENNLENIRSNDAPSAGRAPGVNLNVPDANPFEGLRDLNSKAWGCDALVPDMVTFTLGTPGTLNYLGPGASDLISAADIVGDTYYGTIYGGTFLSMDRATGEFTTIGSTADLTGLAYDYTTSTMYGVDFGGTLYTIDLETGAATVVGSTGGVLIDCACDNEGILYAVDIGSDMFGSIDKTTATFTAISNLPFDANYAQGMQCDHGSDMVYHAAYNNSMGAGQLYSVDKTTGEYTLIGNFQGNTEVDGFAMPAGSIGPIGSLPEHLVGYNVYCDHDFVAYTPHTPAGEYAPQHYVDEGLLPGIYEYTVTAVYDLAPYGYPGETGESMEEGPAEIASCCCFDLEFIETWALGNFEDNNWIADSTNWMVNDQAGNPSPAAEFSRDPILTGYEASLTSYPLCAVGMTEGKIWLDFDLKLDAVEPTGTEVLQVQVLNFETRAWFTVAEYSNAEGSFDWMSEHVDIKSQAMDKVFMIRFHTMGVNSINILGWFVDNIHIYRACEGPTNLTAFIITGQGIGLGWDMPGGGKFDDCIHWEDGMNSGNSNGSRELAGFNIYRNTDGGDFTLLEYYTGGTFIDPAEGFIPGTLYCYIVSAVWMSETDQCESAFSNKACILWTSIPDPDANPDSFSLYPNPADDHIFITTSGELKRVTVYNALGQPVRDEIITGKQYELLTATYTIGVYMVRVETKAGLTTRILTIGR